jgi:3-deoxy-D-arabino-heptulosonate 7-phosphate (DAHP) synthase
MTNRRSTRNQSYGSNCDNKKHTSLKPTSSNGSNTSAVNNENGDENGHIVVDYSDKGNNFNSKKVRLIFKRLRRKNLCNECNNDNYKNNRIEVPDPISEETKSHYASSTIENE